MRKGIIEIGTWTILAGLATLIFNHIHEDILINKKSKLNEKYKIIVMDLREKNCIENPTPEMEYICNQINEEIAKNTLK